jgi:Domain of unknown function (DUF6471)
MSHIGEGAASRMLRAKMVGQGVSYDELAKRLGEIGVKGTSGGLRNKISRGSFTADFFLHCLSVMDIKNIRLDES